MTGRTRILIVDDEEDFCFFVKGNLEYSGQFVVTTANTGQDGIRLARKQHPDLILLDILMPDMSGDEVASILHECSSTKDIPIIFLTAVATHREVGSGTMRNIGGKNVIAKPVETEDLAKCINTVIPKLAGRR